MNVFPPITMTPTELEIVAAKLSDPAVRKYLKMLANKDASTIVMSAPSDGQTPEDYLRAVARTQGHIEVINALLSIQEPVPVVQE